MRIGSIDIDRPIVLAPMEDVTDAAFRIICRRLGADIVYTEFVNSEGLIRDSAKTKEKMMFADEERPFGIQLYGGEESSMEGAARIADSYDPDLIDINCGCWVRDVALRGAGAGLLKDLPRMERIVARVVNTVKRPVTVKTRLGWDEQNIRIIHVARMLEETGIKALTIHCRTRAQAHRGEPDFSWIPKVKAAVTIPIIVNGGMTTPQAIKRVFEETGCDGVMIGRGAVENPWLFRQAKHLLRHGETLPPASLEERVRVLFDHLQLAVKLKGERRGVIEFRKHYSGYLRGLPNAAKVRHELMQYAEMSRVLDRVQQYALSLRTPEPIVVPA